MDKRNEKLQELCREYLSMLRPLAKKFGLERFVDEMIKDNLQEKCKGTQEEVELLSRIVDDERIGRHDVPKVLGKSYRKCIYDDDFSKIKTLHRVGIYSKVSALLHGTKQ